MKYHVVVVETGSAGCVLAAPLSENPNRSVLLLEAGPDYPDLETLPDDLKLGNNVLFSAYGHHNWGYTAFAIHHQSNLTISKRVSNGRMS